MNITAKRIICYILCLGLFVLLGVAVFEASVVHAYNKHFQETIGTVLKVDETNDVRLFHLEVAHKYGNCSLSYDTTPPGRPRNDQETNPIPTRDGKILLYYHRSVCRQYPKEIPDAWFAILFTFGVVGGFFIVMFLIFLWVDYTQNEKDRALETQMQRNREILIDRQNIIAYV